MKERARQRPTDVVVAPHLQHKQFRAGRVQDEQGGVDGNRRAG